MKTKFKKLAIAAVIFCGIAQAQSASADDWRRGGWDRDHDRGYHRDRDYHGRRNVVVRREYYNAPVRYYGPTNYYYDPYYTYVAPAPVYVAPRPVYVQPAPVASFNFRF